MKKQQLKEENERLREKLLKAENELQIFKRQEENEKIRSLLEQLNKEFGFSVDHEISCEYCDLFNIVIDIYTLKRETRNLSK